MESSWQGRASIKYSEHDTRWMILRFLENELQAETAQIALDGFLAEGVSGSLTSSKIALTMGISVGRSMDEIPTSQAIQKYEL